MFKKITKWKTAKPSSVTDKLTDIRLFVFFLSSVTFTKTDSKIVALKSLDYSKRGFSSIFCEKKIILIAHSLKKYCPTLANCPSFILRMIGNNASHVFLLFVLILTWNKVLGGRHSTVVAFLLHTQLSRFEPDCWKNVCVRKKYVLEKDRNYPKYVLLNQPE